MERENSVRGVEAVENALAAESFPMVKEGLYYAVGDLEVESDRGRRLAVRQILDRVERSRFESVAQAVADLRAALASAESPAPAGTALSYDAVGPQGTMIEPGDVEVADLETAVEASEQQRRDSAQPGDKAVASRAFMQAVMIEAGDIEIGDLDSNN